MLTLNRRHVACRELNNGAVEPRRKVRYFGVGNMIRAALLSVEFCQGLLLQDVRGDLANPCSVYHTDSFRHLSRTFIPQLDAMSQSDQHDALVNFYLSGRASPPSDGERASEAGRQTALLLLTMGMDAFQPWKRRVYSITLMGFRCVNVDLPCSCMILDLATLGLPKLYICDGLHVRLRLARIGTCDTYSLTKLLAQGTQPATDAFDKGCQHLRCCHL